MSVCLPLSLSLSLSVLLFFFFICLSLFLSLDTLIAPILSIFLSLPFSSLSPFPISSLASCLSLCSVLVPPHAVSLSPVLVSFPAFLSPHVLSTCVCSVCLCLLSPTFLFLFVTPPTPSSLAIVPFLPPLFSPISCLSLTCSLPHRLAVFFHSLLSAPSLLPSSGLACAPAPLRWMLICLRSYLLPGASVVETWCRLLS
ncbi:hypothetical protein U0070_015524 [Myodes glareolus]|uniref:Uncharacterized protein n=1 Tax=Myodes glareolus TaxID=447135 RepID=A0AAW0IG58_MYOGA